MREVALAEQHGCALLDEPAGVVCWGNHSSGQLGVPQGQPTPALVQGLGANVTSVVVGESDTCAVVDGGAKCWGSNADFQLGTGSTDWHNYAPETPVGLDAGVTSIGCAFEHTCAAVGGAAKCWGTDGNYSGKLGFGGLPHSSAEPRDVEQLATGVTAVSTGSFHTCAIVDGGAQCWGDNSSGALGADDTVWASDYPLPVPGLSQGVTRIRAGWALTCAIVDGEVLCWGTNRFGQLGDGTMDEERSVPMPVVGLLGPVTDIATYFYDTCALSEGSVYCWGAGFMSGVEQRTATKVPGIEGATALGVGKEYACAVVDGTLSCWGESPENPLAGFDPFVGGGGSGGSGTSNPYGPCTIAGDCPLAGSMCAATTGACAPPCTGVGDCPEADGGGPVTCDAGRCAITCDATTPCPLGMTCLAAVTCAWP